MSTAVDSRIRRSGNPRIKSLVGRLGLLLVILLFIVVMSFMSPVFLSVANFKNLFIQSTILAVLALGQTYVIMTRGIDLSIGGTMALSSAVCIGLTVYSGLPVALSILSAVAIGAGVGLVNGLSVTKIGITPLIVTLATLSITRGATFVYTNGANITPVPELIAAFGRGQALGVPYSVLVLAALAVACHAVLKRSVFGRSVYATGGNELASQLAGIPTERIIVVTYVICGLTAAIAGLILTARLEFAGPRAGIRHRADGHRGVRHRRRQSVRRHGLDHRNASGRGSDFAGVQRHQPARRTAGLGRSCQGSSDLRGCRRRRLSAQIRPKLNQIRQTERRRAQAIERLNIPVISES